MDLINLPDDILLLVIEHCDIASFCHLRLACHSTNELINVYWGKLIPCIATSNYPGAPRLLTNEPPDGIWSLHWLSRIRFKYLATILIDRLRTSYLTNDEGIVYHIPASAPEGDVLRARLANGWLLLHRISIALHEANLAKHRLKLVHRLRIRANMGDKFGTRRDALLYYDRIQRIAKLLRTVSEKDAADFLILWELLHWVFWSDRDGFAAGGGRQARQRRNAAEFFDWGSPLRYGTTTGSWTDWLMLYYGPELFWLQWSGGRSSNGGEVAVAKQLMLKEWREREPKQIDGERNTAKMIMKLVAKVCAHRLLLEFGAGVYPLARVYFDDYLRQTESLKSETSHLEFKQVEVRTAMDNVPFIIDFRSSN